MKDKNRIIIFIAIIVALFVGLIWYAIPSKNENKKESVVVDKSSSASALQAGEALYDFGVISMKNGVVSKIFKVNNTSNTDVFIPDLTTSCMCTKAFFVMPDGSKKGPFGMPSMGFVPKLNEYIKAGQSADIQVDYDPNAHGPAGVGMIDRFIYLADDSGHTLQLEIKANVTP